MRRGRFFTALCCLGLGVLSALVQQVRAMGADLPAAQIAVEVAAVDDPARTPGQGILTPADEALLEDLQRRGLQFFLDSTDPVTGLMSDRAKTDGSKPGDVASIASVGFGLTAICIGEQRGWISRDEAYERCYRVLRFLRDEAPQHHGHFYHFMHMSTGERAWNCEVSNIDTAILIAGALVVRQHFANTELASIADELYRRVEWGWLMQPDGTLSMGWRPESGFIKAKWDHYSEGAPLIVLLALGSPTHPLKPEAWHAWRREPVGTYAGLTYLQYGPLFTHQYPQCWFDLRGLRDDYVAYFRNSQLATIAQRQWTIDELSQKWPTYGPDMWGLTASDSATGYHAWGGPPATGPIDGSVVPAAPGGSLPFDPRRCLDALHAMRKAAGDKAYGKYGFADAFNPSNGWVNEDVIGIDIGPIVVMAENLRTGSVWKTFMSAPELQAALKAAGFRPMTTAERAAATNAVFQSGSR